MIEIRKAQRFKAKLRLGIAGPSGSGKTMSSLKLAKGVYDSWTINFSTEPIPNSVAYPAGICGWINGSDHFIIGKR